MRITRLAAVVVPAAAALAIGLTVVPASASVHHVAASKRNGPPYYLKNTDGQWAGFVGKGETINMGPWVASARLQIVRIDAFGANGVTYYLYQSARADLVTGQFYCVKEDPNISGRPMVLWTCDASGDTTSQEEYIEDSSNSNGAIFTTLYEDNIDRCIPSGAATAADYNNQMGNRCGGPNQFWLYVSTSG